jgi:hypothetical protein
MGYEQRFPIERLGRYAAIHAAAFFAYLLVGASVCQASPLTYLVNRTVGKGSVTGFLETDGTMGVLTAGNFVDWNLLLSDGSSSFRLTGPLSGNNSQVVVTGTDVGAFNNFLVFNFSGIDSGTLLFSQGPFARSHYYCDSSQPYICVPGETMVLFDIAENVRLLGNVPIGTLDAAPEPGTLGLLMIGGSWVAWRVRSRNHV